LLSVAADQARAIGCHTALKFYLGLSNYVNNPKRLGFADAAVTGPGSDRLFDAAAAHGTADQIVHRLNEHIDAGAGRLASCSRFAQHQAQQAREAVLNLVTPKAVAFEVPVVPLPNQPRLD
jgi:hypothetical protein